MSKCAIGDCYVEREDAIEVLRQIRKRINVQWRGFICIECENVAQAQPELVNAATAVRKWVVQMLDGCYTYDTWIRLHHPTLYVEGDDCDLRTVHDLAKEGRLAWIDWMIEEVTKP